MRIQNIMRVVGQVILILASFIMVPFFLVYWMKGLFTTRFLSHHV